MSAGGFPELSVVIAARDAANTLPTCLRALNESAKGLAEVIVVDDGSLDSTGDIARRAGVKLIRHDSPAGPAAARNAGARRASAPIVMFLDADIALARDAIPRVVGAFASDPELGAVFGSYDDAPAANTLVSQYRNLLHHFVHQSSREESASFWGGCGAVRRTVFFGVDGFDERYQRPSIEDIELGSRLARAGVRVRLDKGLVGQHLKQWTLAKLVLVDIRDRAYPWARLLLRQGRVPSDLNLQHSHRASGVLVWVGLLAAAGSIAGWPDGTRFVLVIVLIAALAGVAILNRQFYRFLVQRKGIAFTAAAFLLHALYYAYASATFGWCWIRHHALGDADASP